MSKQFYLEQVNLAKVCSLNVKTVLFQVIQFNISTHFSSIWPIDRALSGTPHFPSLQHYWNFTIRLFCVIFGRSLGYPSAEMHSGHSTAPADWVIILFNPLLEGYGVSNLSQMYSTESEHDSSNGVRTRLLRRHNSVL